MPTYEVYDDWTARAVSVDAKSGRKFKRAITVRTSDPTFTWGGEAVDAMSVIAGVYIGSPHPNWSSARCIRIGDADSHPDDPSLFIIPVDYEEPLPVPGQVYGVSPPPPGGPPPPPGQNTGTPPEPEYRDPIPKVSFREVPYYKPYDLLLNAFKNTAGDLLEDPPPMFRNNGLLRWRVHRATWSFALGMLVNGKVNQYDWNGLLAKTLKVNIENAEAVTEKGRTFWVVDYLIEYNEDLWIPTKVLNAGRRYKDADGKFVLPTDEKKGFSTNNLVLLDAAGMKTTTPLDLEFTLFGLLDFAML